MREVPSPGTGREKLSQLSKTGSWRRLNELAGQAKEKPSTGKKVTMLSKVNPNPPVKSLDLVTVKEIKPT